MDRLTSLIGLAPSEQSLESFLVRLMEERQRVVNSLLAFRVEPIKTRSKKKDVIKKISVTQKADTLRALEAKAEEMGLSLDEMMARLTSKGS